MGPTSGILLSGLRGFWSLSILQFSEDSTAFWKLDLLLPSFLSSGGNRYDFRSVTLFRMLGDKERREIK
jgi:hypothetical protein